MRIRATSDTFGGTATAKQLISTRAHQYVVRILLGIVFAVFASLFLPWQQNVVGRGVVTPLNPADRPQEVPSLIAGRIEQWHVAEGQFVQKGDLIVEISEIKDTYLDPKTLDRYSDQVNGKTQSLEAKHAKVAALRVQLAALNSLQALGLEKARNGVSQYEAAARAAEVDSVVADQQYERNRRLFEDGLKSRAEFEAYQMKLQATRAKLVEKRQELANGRIQLLAVAAEYGEKNAKTQADLQSTQADIGDGLADVAKLRNQRDALAQRIGMYRIGAPQDGYVVRAAKAGIGETVKEGESLVTIMPANIQQAVELFVKPMDVPLITQGRQVRLQFDGWPALQFSGWPAVAVGTFGGVVRVVDAINSVDGTYRLLIVPDSTDDAWPLQLRTGSGVLGWTMLDEVPLWFEIWRRFNGFPPTLRDGIPGTSTGPDK